MLGKLVEFLNSNTNVSNEIKINSKEPTESEDTVKDESWNLVSLSCSRNINFKPSVYQIGSVGGGLCGVSTHVIKYTVNSNVDLKSYIILLNALFKTFLFGNIQNNLSFKIDFPVYLKIF